MPRSVLIPPTLPDWAGAESRIRLELAWKLAESCPLELGVEIALTGSAARGVADGDSDIELNLWVDTLPELEQRDAWLASAGCTDNSGTAEPFDDGFAWNTCRCSGIWLEVGWGLIADFDQRVRRIASGEVTEYRPLTLAWMVQQAVVLRTEGRLARWRQALSVYPVALAARIITDNTEVWSDPHVPGVRFGLARRKQLFALSMRLQWDMQNLLRILWAINRRWDQDWKWIDERSLDLPIKPERLSERITGVFALNDPTRSARDCYELVLEGLALVPREHDMSGAIRSIRDTLEAEARGKAIVRVCGAILRDGAIAMVHVQHESHSHWTLPGGAVEAGETPEEAVIREVLEETGLCGERPAPLFDRVWSEDGIERCFLIEVPPDREPVLGHDPELAADVQQLRAVAWRPLAELRHDLQMARVLEALDEQS